VAERIDSLGLLDATLALPEQVEAAAAAAVDIDHLPAHDDVANVVVLGIGSSGLAGDLLAAVAAPFMPVPLIVSKGYEPPSFVDPSTLVIAISFSGDTEETVQALMTAVEAGAQILDIGGAGEMADVAEVWDLPWVPLPSGIPVPRAAIGALMIPPMLALEQMGLFPGAGVWVDEAVEQLRKRRDQLTGDRSPAKALAHEIGRTIPLIYGGGELGAAAAKRWKAAHCKERSRLTHSNREEPSPLVDHGLCRALEGPRSGSVAGSEGTRKVI
jgi:glucose/mannose-6-phosphate isomerase